MGMTNHEFIKANNARPASERLGWEALINMGVVRRLIVTLDIEDETFNCAEYYDPERISHEEVLGNAALALTRALEKHEKGKV